MSCRWKTRILNAHAIRDEEAGGTGRCSRALPSTSYCTTPTVTRYLRSDSACEEAMVTGGAWGRGQQEQRPASSQPERNAPCRQPASSRRNVATSAIAHQRQHTSPWVSAWHSSQHVGGVDGQLARRCSSGISCPHAVTPSPFFSHQQFDALPTSAGSALDTRCPSVNRLVVWNAWGRILDMANVFRATGNSSG